MLHYKYQVMSGKTTLQVTRATLYITSYKWCVATLYITSNMWRNTLHYK